MNQEQLNAIGTYAAEQREKQLPTAVFVEVGDYPDESFDIAMEVADRITDPDNEVITPPLAENANDWDTVFVNQVGLGYPLEELRKKVSYQQRTKLNVVIHSPSLSESEGRLVDYAIQDNGMGTHEAYESLRDSLAGKTHLKRVNPEPSRSTQSE